MKRILLLCAMALCTAVGPAQATDWNIVQFWPNPTYGLTYTPSHEALYYQQSSTLGPDGEHKVAGTLITTWNFTNETGTFFLLKTTTSMFNGTPCTLQHGPSVFAGLSSGSIPGYGTPNSGYDWYGVDATGIYIKGWEAFGGSCESTIVNFTGRTGVLYPHHIYNAGTSGIVWGPQNFSFVGTETRYNDKGKVLYYNIFGPVYAQSFVSAVAGGTQLVLSGTGCTANWGACGTAANLPYWNDLIISNMPGPSPYGTFSHWGTCPDGQVQTYDPAGGPDNTECPPVPGHPTTLVNFDQGWVPTPW